MAKIRMKTNSAAKKRFRKLSSGLVKCSRAYHRHLLARKSKNRKRHLRSTAYVNKVNISAVYRLLPY